MTIRARYPLYACESDLQVFSDAQPEHIAKTVASRLAVGAA
jgi:hypothetical protein